MDVWMNKGTKKKKIKKNSEKEWQTRVKILWSMWRKASSVMSMQAANISHVKHSWIYVVVYPQYRRRKQEPNRPGTHPAPIHSRSSNIKLNHLSNHFFFPSVCVCVFLLLWPHRTNCSGCISPRWMSSFYPNIQRIANNIFRFASFKLANRYWKLSLRMILSFVLFARLITRWVKKTISIECCCPSWFMEMFLKLQKCQKRRFHHGWRLCCTLLRNLRWWINTITRERWGTGGNWTVVMQQTHKRKKSLNTQRRQE